MRSDLLFLMVTTCNQVLFHNTTKSVRIEFGKAGKESISPVFYHDGTPESIYTALVKCLESVPEGKELLKKEGIAC